MKDPISKATEKKTYRENNLESIAFLVTDIYVNYVLANDISIFTFTYFLNVMTVLKYK